MQHILLFTKPEFRPGLNVTVRRGKRWFDTSSVNDELNIYRTGNENPHERIAFGKIEGLAYIPFLSIPSDWLAVEHDRACHDLNGLLKAMVQAYPDFNPMEIVTVILFRIERLGD